VPDLVLVLMLVPKTPLPSLPSLSSGAPPAVGLTGLSPCAARGGGASVFFVGEQSCGPTHGVAPRPQEARHRLPGNSSGASIPEARGGASPPQSHSHSHSQSQSHSHCLSHSQSCSHSLSHSLSHSHSQSCSHSHSQSCSHSLSPLSLSVLLPLSLSLPWVLGSSVRRALTLCFLPLRWSAPLPPPPLGRQRGSTPQGSPLGATPGVPTVRRPGVAAERALLTAWGGAVVGVTIYALAVTVHVPWHLPLWHWDRDLSLCRERVSLSRRAGSSLSDLRSVLQRTSFTGLPLSEAWR